MLGDRLRELREKKGMMQADVAKLLKVQPATISRYEKDKNEPDVKTILWYADYFNCTTDYILGRVDIPSLKIKELSSEDGRKLEVAFDKNRPELQNEEYLRKLIVDELRKMRENEQ